MQLLKNNQFQPKHIIAMRKNIVAGNWKMNKTPSEAVALENEYHSS